MYKLGGGVCGRRESQYRGHDGSMWFKAVDGGCGCRSIDGWVLLKTIEQF